jgi:hypothetical protein
MRHVRMLLCRSYNVLPMERRARSVPIWPLAASRPADRCRVEPVAALRARGFREQSTLVVMTDRLRHHAEQLRHLTDPQPRSHGAPLFIGSTQTDDSTLSQPWFNWMRHPCRGLGPCTPRSLYPATFNAFPPIDPFSQSRSCLVPDMPRSHCFTRRRESAGGSPWRSSPGILGDGWTDTSPHS